MDDFFPALKPGGRDVNIAKKQSQVDIGHHRQKWKSPILGVARIVLCDVFLLLFFLAYVEPKKNCAGNKFSSAAPIHGL